MQPLRKPLLVAAAAGALIGGGALAASAYTHHLQVVLPDGQIAQVDYVGDVAPRVVVQTAATAPAAPAGDPFMAVGFPGFANMDRIFAEMQQRQAAMLQQAAAMEHDIAAHRPALVATGSSPANGNVGWSYVSSTTTGNGCTQTVEWSSQGSAAKDAQPRVVRTSAGNCDKAVNDTPVHPVTDMKQQAETPAGKTV